MKSHEQAEYYKRAAEARRLAKDAADPEVKVDLFAVEQRWLSLASDTPDEEEVGEVTTRALATPGPVQSFTSHGKEDPPEVITKSLS
jgi:hypothetical protein